MYIAVVEIDSVRLLLTMLAECVRSLMRALGGINLVVNANAGVEGLWAAL